MITSNNVHRQKSIQFSRPGGPNPALDPDRLLPFCWRNQDCTSCLSSHHHHCSWCATSSVCVPNPETWPLLAPIWKSNVCPTRDERWELRGNELGCRVSTVTFLSVMVAVFATLGLLVLGWLVKLFWAWSSKRWKRWSGWCKGMSMSIRDGFKNWLVTPLRKPLLWPGSKMRAYNFQEPAGEESRLLD